MCGCGDVMYIYNWIGDRPSDEPGEVLNGASKVQEAPPGAPRCNICCSLKEGFINFIYLYLDNISIFI